MFHFPKHCAIPQSRYYKLEQLNKWKKEAKFLIKFHWENAWLFSSSIIILNAEFIIDADPIVVNLPKITKNTEQTSLEEIILNEKVFLFCLRSKAQDLTYFHEN